MYRGDRNWREDPTFDLGKVKIRWAFACSSAFVGDIAKRTFLVQRAKYWMEKRLGQQPPPLETGLALNTVQCSENKCSVLGVQTSVQI